MSYISWRNREAFHGVPLAICDLAAHQTHVPPLFFSTAWCEVLAEAACFIIYDILWGTWCNLNVDGQRKRAQHMCVCHELKRQNCHLTIIQFTTILEMSCFCWLLVEMQLACHQTIPLKPGVSDPMQLNLQPYPPKEQTKKKKKLLVYFTINYKEMAVEKLKSTPIIFVIFTTLNPSDYSLCAKHFRGMSWGPPVGGSRS